MKRISIILAAALALVISGNLSAQQKADPKGGISADMLKEIRKGYEGTASDKAIKNALNTTAIGVLAANSENIAMIDTHFSDQVKTKGITDQKSSGRCWLFSGLNVLRARMIDKYDLGPFTFSQNYCFFYDQLEKANLFLQGVIDTKDKGFDDREVDWLFSNPIGDGGQFTGVANLVMKYGVVPSDIMPETLNANSTSAMRTQIATKLREDGLKLREAKPKDCQALKTEMLKEIYRMLVLCLGRRRLPCWPANTSAATVLLPRRILHGGAAWGLWNAGRGWLHSGRNSSRNGGKGSTFIATAIAGALVFAAAGCICFRLMTSILSATKAAK